MGIADAGRTRCGDIGRVFTKIRHAQIAQQLTAVGMRIGAHAAFAFGGQFSQFRFQASLLIKELFRPVAFKPIFQQLEMLGMGCRV